MIIYSYDRLMGVELLSGEKERKISKESPNRTQEWLRFITLPSFLRSEYFWERIKKWFLVSALIGLVVGLLVTLFYYVVYFLMWEKVRTQVNYVSVIIFPTIGLFLSGYLLHRYSRNPALHDTEEIIFAYHEKEGVVDTRPFIPKVLAAAATLGSGGSAGMEGPSFYIGGAVSSWLVRKLMPLGFSRRDIRLMMLAGSAAGISAIFKAPLTGIIFALEAPYRDDVTREALLPSLFSSSVAYLVIVSILGGETLFFVHQAYTFNFNDLLGSLLFGLVIGILARIFVIGFNFTKKGLSSLRLPLYLKTLFGGLITGLIGAASLSLFDAPLAIGIGYDTIRQPFVADYDTRLLLLLLVMKAVATIATLGSGAAGGIFIPLITMGAITGAVFRNLFSASIGSLFPIVGMASFLAAGYNTPLAAVSFIAETTNGSGYIIPGLLASAVSFTLAGRVSVSEFQKWRRESRFDRMLKLKVRDIMTPNPICVPADISLLDFVNDYIIKCRHKSFPVVNKDGLCGIVALSDVNKVPVSRWKELKVIDVANCDVFTVTPDTPLSSLLDVMAEKDFDRVPVVDPHDPKKVVGIVSTTDILWLIEKAEKSARL